MRPASLALALAVIGALAFAPAPCAAGAADPLAWLATFAAAYESGDAAIYGALLDEDFRYQSGDRAIEEQFPQGFSRREELSLYERLFHGARAEDGAELPRALRLEVDWQEVTTLPDPEFPDDPAHVLVRVGAATLAIEFGNGSVMKDAAPHAFALALVGDGATWACRRWSMQPRLETLAGPDAPPGDIVAEDELRGAPSWTPLPNPARATTGLSYVYEVATPGEPVLLELFDAAGRRVATLVRGTPAAGRHVARWDGRNDRGMRPAPGVYFVRAKVGLREERSRVILLD